MSEQRFQVGDRVVRLKDGPRGLMAGQHYVVREIWRNSTMPQEIAVEGITNVGIEGPFFYSSGFELVKRIDVEPKKVDTEPARMDELQARQFVLQLRPHSPVEDLNRVVSWLQGENARYSLTEADLKVLENAAVSPDAKNIIIVIKEVYGR